MGLMSVGGGTRIDLLWTNSSPASSFKAQTVSLDLSSYKSIICVAYNSISSLFCMPAVFADVQDGSGIILGSRDGRYRSFTVSKNGVSFIDAQDQSAAANNTCVPYKIYGLKI